MARASGRDIRRRGQLSDRLQAVLAAGAVLLGVSCGGGSGGSPSPTPPPPPPPVSTECVVSAVSDGDTLTCTDSRRIRLTGIDAPELDQMPYGEQSRAALVDLVDDRTLRLEFDVETTDVFGRTLAYLWLGDLFINEEMVRRGWAVAYHIPPNAKYVSRFNAAEDAAQAENAGLWATGGFDCLPSDHRADLC